MPSAAATTSRDHHDSTPSIVRRNFVVLALHQAVMRTGWIFKTESVVMPAVLDTLSGSALLRGCLPMLNRLGQSAPPIFLAQFVHGLRHKRFFLAACTTAMGVSFLLMAWAWRQLDPIYPELLTWIFVVLYTLFFVAAGLQQVTLGTLTGKLVRIQRRGSLMTWANLAGGISAILCAWFLLQPWMMAGRGHFVNIFLFAGVMFLFAAGLTFGVREQKEIDFPDKDGTWSNIRAAFLEAWHITNYRRLVIICFLYGLSITLFPHYQSLGRQRLGLGMGQLVPWLIAQNIGVTIFSIPVGWVADRLGNRLAMRGLLLVISLTPLLALGLSQFVDLGPAGFWFVFLLLGLFPITIRIISNYALEIAPHNDHANYLSVVNLAMSLPAILCAPLVGWAIDRWGFDLAFVSVACLVFLAFVLTPTLHEPRHQASAIQIDLWKDPETET